MWCNVRINMAKAKQTRCVVAYVTDAKLKLRTFDSVRAMNIWINKFWKENPGRNENWIDFSITGVNGKISVYEGLIDVEAHEQNR